MGHRGRQNKAGEACVITGPPQTPAQYQIHHHPSMSAQDSPSNPPLLTPLDFGQFITTMSPDLDHEIKVIENLQITLMRRMFQGYRTMTENQWLQTQGKIISLNERKAQILDKQDPLPARMERRNVAEVYK